MNSHVYFHFYRLSKRKCPKQTTFEHKIQEGVSIQRKKENLEKPGTKLTLQNTFPRIGHKGLDQVAANP